MKTWFLIVFGLISLAITIGFSVCAYRLFKTGKKYRQVLSAVQVLTVGIFLSVFAIFIPYHYLVCDFGDAIRLLRPAFIAFYNTVRIFLLNAEFSLIVESVADESVLLSVLFSGYAAALYVIAPVLTFGNVLSVFKNLQGVVRFYFSKDKKCYIFSELNEKSIALAESVPDKTALLVFTGVPVLEDEGNRLLSDAKDLKAICLKRDITKLDYISRTAPVEIFLIGQDESQNVSQAVQLTTELNERNTKHNVKIFVFSTKPSAACILDSLEYNNLLDHAAKYEYKENTFKLRRVDEKRQLIWNTVPKMHPIWLADRHDKKLSVLIVGFGSYGTEFFKMMVWYCQVEGYKLQFHIVDRQEDYIESVLKRDCPDLLNSGGYDIKIYSGVDAELSGLNDLLLYDGEDVQKKADADRLRSTNLAFVSMGDDDTNIEVSIRLRQLLDRVRGFVADEETSWTAEKVDIYSVVFDDRKADILYKESAPSRLLKNHKEIPYHIRFIGALSSQFQYANIYDEALEDAAFKNHVAWVNVEVKGDGAQPDGKDCQTHEEGEDTKKRNEQRKYQKYEYFRLSSISKELYKRDIDIGNALRKIQCLGKPKSGLCTCEMCATRQRNEHLRWNAYTRAIGFVSGPRADRALQHDSLCDWASLDDHDKKKD